MGKLGVGGKITIKQTDVESIVLLVQYVFSWLNTGYTGSLQNIALNLRYP